LVYENTDVAISQRKDFLTNNNIGICDIVASATRKKIDASDIGMEDVVLRDLISVLEKYPKVTTLLFTGGNSKNGPEYFFRRYLKQYGISLTNISSEVPRIHEVILPKSLRKIKTVSLIAPSGAANRAVGSLQKYKEMKLKYPSKTTIDFRVEQYKKHF
jgi:G:T/U-mismatch repair DNA glycosylase